MKRTLLIAKCRELADAGVWCIPENTLMASLGYPERGYFRVAMSRHCKAGLIERMGPKLYANPFLKPPAFGLYRLANFLRPNEDFYLSVESVLSEHGWISQMPFCLTFVTTGRSYRYTTLLGDIDFVHTEESTQAWMGKLERNQQRQIWEATPDKALEDLRRYARNLDLVLPEDERE
ncbi:hypothetical protein IFT48_04325 [Pseudomonas fluorescens]|uniref:type IV toxin-antitoxin system AbiEi family antitoxin n=1 Tax=Pseudomonas fluorescens TaxID=294 RepID=UPI001930CB15|nr:hypothetical protein [Pseudomonas fluorescens]MBD8089198.1 hypothetical protein [Pseudomonas fluorescens]